MSDHESPFHAAPSPSAPGPEVPEEVVEALREAFVAAAEHAKAGPNQQTARAALNAEDALLAAISRALAAISRALGEAREGTLREAAEAIERQVLAPHFTADTRAACARVIRALASPPPSHEEGGR